MVFSHLELKGMEGNFCQMLNLNHLADFEYVRDMHLEDGAHFLIIEVQNKK